MKTVVFYLFLLIGILSLKAQNKNFEEGMKKGFEMFDKGEEFKDWLGGAESLVSLSDKHPNEWLSYYWASYMYTQLARGLPKNPPKGITREKMVDNAQVYINKGKQRIKDWTIEQEVDFHMLQQLIYSFRKPPEDDKEKFKKLADIELKDALRKDPNHPLVLVSVGIDLYFADGDFRNTYGANALLMKAKGIFDNRLKPRYMSTDYAEQWVEYWAPVVQKKLLELVNK